MTLDAFGIQVSCMTLSIISNRIDYTSGPEPHQLSPSAFPLQRRRRNRDAMFCNYDFRLDCTAVVQGGATNVTTSLIRHHVEMSLR
ncbi:hypothetical protein EVAR_4312_1 [Eumeta japonica]|uniref:Uncharacterized protein n=1 Tax=Eumeta variegata TaxID=151549 RepID=A0A4C1VAL6_EUMVA|nr:hypothetical protein EVAR_4312_1 [Eumeta japonica]